MVYDDLEVTVVLRKLKIPHGGADIDNSEGRLAIGWPERGAEAALDTDLFHLIALGLMAVGVLALLALLSTLSGIKRALEKGGPGASLTSSAAVPASTSSQPEPAATEPVVATQAASIRTVLEEEGAVPVQAQPVQAQPVQAQPVQAQPVQQTQPQPVAQEAQPADQTSAFAAHVDAGEPQDEPFQRDGRWWFRRGDELLVYDDAIGQWIPVQPAGVAAPATAGAPATATVTAEAAPVAASTTGWKCANCGAVNGSTATSCRMCFTARP
jgi:hypothetical protein